MNWKALITQILTNYRWTVTLVALGLILFILIVTINFWRTLLLCIVVGICFFLGRLLDKGGWAMVKSFLDRILPK